MRAGREQGLDRARPEGLLPPQAAPDPMEKMPGAHAGFPSLWSPSSVQRRGQEPSVLLTLLTPP